MRKVVHGVILVGLTLCIVGYSVFTVNAECGRILVDQINDTDTTAWNGANQLLRLGASGNVPNSVLKLSGVHRSSSITYISGTGIAGSNNSAETLKTVTLPANTLTQIGDRLRIRTYWNSNTGTTIVGMTSLNAALVGDKSHVGPTSFNLTESWVHYIDATHANIIEQQEGGALGSLSAANVDGFNWSASQDIVFAQSAASGTHLTLFEIIIDILPKGT